MKHLRHSALAILSGLLALGIHATAGPEIHDRVSAKDLRIRKARETAFIGKQDTRAEDPRVRPPKGQSILAESVLLGNGRNWTLVPKGSVLHLPENLEKHILENAEGEIMPWQKFLARNRSWLTTAEVDMDTATGRKPIPDSKLKAWTRTGSIVVAIHRGGAISVRRKPESESESKPEPEPKKSTS